MSDIIGNKLCEWIEGQNALDARISVFEKIRDIPYAVVPELLEPERYLEILKENKGSCTPKHFLLCNMYQRLGITVLYVVYPFRWDELEIDYPSNLRKLAEQMPLSYHLACKADIGGNLVLLDATIDKPLERLGLPVNKNWDGLTDTLLPIKPRGEEQIYHPSEASHIEATLDESSLAFYGKLNSWLEDIRSYYQRR